jgi:hypothetical protein
LRGGSRLARVMKATALGSVAAMVGAALYYAFVRLTHINLGLVAVVLGLMVGGAIRKGSGNRGGKFYQLLAVFLAYSAIVGMDAPLVIEGLKQVAQQKKPQANGFPKEIEKPSEKVKAELKGPVIVKDAPAPPNADIPSNPFVDAPAELAKEKVAVAKDDGAVNVRVAAEPEVPVFSYAIVVAFLVVAFWAGPVLEAVESPISGLIYGFALWEAWKMNRAVKLSFNGPFRVGAQGLRESYPQADDHGG